MTQFDLAEKMRLPRPPYAASDWEVVALNILNLSLATDTPIKDSERDLIGRAPFAERLADILKSAAGPESLVIGLYGSWG